eukprot:scaffold23379_cov71-Phaeocystis_antarctica.AAC.2
MAAAPSFSAVPSGAVPCSCGGRPISQSVVAGLPCGKVESAEVLPCGAHRARPYPSPTPNPNPSPTANPNP